MEFNNKYNNDRENYSKEKMIVRQLEHEYGTYNYSIKENYYVIIDIRDSELTINEIKDLSTHLGIKTKY